MYDVGVAIKNIIEYAKHKMRDAQLRKAKVDAFDVVCQTKEFWLKYFAQKVLPVRCREGQKNFGKR